MQFLLRPGFQKWLQTWSAPLLYLFCIASFMIGYFLLLQNEELKNTTASNGIISLEISTPFSKDTAIVGSWKRTTIIDTASSSECRKISRDLLVVAGNNTRVDFFFIICYTCFAVLLILRLQQKKQGYKRFTKLLLWAAVLAGLMDVVENIALLKLIAHNYSSGGLTNIIKNIGSYTKFILLLILLAWLAWKLFWRHKGLPYLSFLMGRRLEQLIRYRVIFLGIIGFVIPIWILDQGQDLLVNSNSSNIGIILFLVTIIIIAFLNWYLAKLFFAEKYEGPVYPFVEPRIAGKKEIISEKKLSRFFGVITIVLPAIAILNALKITGIRYLLDIYPPTVLLFMWALIFFVLIKYEVAEILFRPISKNKNKRVPSLVGIFVLLALAVLIPLLVKNLKVVNINKTDSLICLYWHLIFLAFAFYFFVSVRSLAFGEGGWTGKRVGVPIFIVSLIASLFFLLVNIMPVKAAAWDKGFLTLPLLMSGAIFYIFLVTLLIRTGKWVKVNILVLLILAGLVFSAALPRKYHNVDLLVVEKADTTLRRMELDEYFTNWLLKRKDEILKLDSNSYYPVYLVNTHGGGIRAAAYTSMVLTYLDSMMITQNGKAFQHYMFSISGASGGTVGAALQCAYRDRYQDTLAYYKQSIFSDFYQHDFLTSILIADVGRDVWASALPFAAWSDRAKVQEEVWNNFASKYLQLNMGNYYESIWSVKDEQKKYEVPLLFSNTLNVDDGLKGITAPVHLREYDFPATIFINDRVDSLNLEARRHDSTSKDKYISLTTGTFLSARFPFMSPSGKLGAGYHFMDGGGKDNSGASTSGLIFECLTRYTEKLRQDSATDPLIKKLLCKIRFYFLSISSSPNRNEPRKLVDNRFEPLSPLVGIINSGIDGNAHAADYTLFSRYSDPVQIHQGFNTRYFAFYPTERCIQDVIGEPYIPVLPLGWQISEPALRRLSNSVTKPRADPTKTSGSPAGLYEVMRK